MSEWTTNDDLNRDLVEGIMKNEKSDDEPVDGTGLTPKEALAMKIREKLIRTECDFIANMLAEKNRNYGDSALNPVRIMSQADPVEQIRVRIDDKLSRIKRGKSAGEDVVLDLIGYFILLRIAMRRQHVTGSVKRCSEHGGIGFVSDCVDCAKPESNEASALVMLRNLLARVHRDGGHHTQEVGLALSFKDADERVALLNAERADRAEPGDESWGLVVRHKLAIARGLLEGLLEEKEEGKTGEFTAEQIRQVLNETADPERRYDAVAGALSWLWSVYPQSRGDVRKQMRTAMLLLGRGPDEDESGYEPADRAIELEQACEELRAEAKRAWSHLEEIAKALGCGTSQVQILMALTKTMADATRETEEARNGRDEAIRQRDALRIERDALAADNRALLARDRGDRPNT